MYEKGGGGGYLSFEMINVLLCLKTGYHYYLTLLPVFSYLLKSDERVDYWEVSMRGTFIGVQKYKYYFSLSRIEASSILSS